MCQHLTHQVNVSRKGVLCAPDSSKYFETPCSLETNWLLKVAFAVLTVSGIAYQGKFCH